MIATGQDPAVKAAEAKKIMEAFCTAHDVTAWAASRRYLHGFSIGNQILLTVQIADRKRQAEQVVTGSWGPVQAAWRWRKAGFFPARKTTLPEYLQGAMWVWGPQKLKKNRDGSWLCRRCDTRSHGARCPNGHERQSRFVLLPVFSRLQVVDDQDCPPPGPPRGAPIVGDSHEHLIPRLCREAGKLQYTVAFKRPGQDADLAGTDGGYCDPAERRIVVNDESSANEKVATLLHEIAHALGVDYSTHARRHAEAIVETASYLAAAAIGLDMAPRSLAYVAGWAGANGDAPYAAVQGHMRLIDDLAKRLERMAEPNKEDGCPEQ